MEYLIIDIDSCSQDSFPGWFKGSFKDAFNRTWHIEDKFPIVIFDTFSNDCFYSAEKTPKKAYIPGDIVSVESGTICFSTEREGVESIDGVAIFHINNNQLVTFEMISLAVDEYYNSNSYLCSFTDAFGKIWFFNDRVITSSYQNADAGYCYYKAFLIGEPISEQEDVICISTKRPYNTKSTDGNSTFYIRKSQIYHLR